MRLCMHMPDPDVRLRLAPQHPSACAVHPQAAVHLSNTARSAPFMLPEGLTPIPSQLARARGGGAAPLALLLPAAVALGSRSRVKVMEPLLVALAAGATDQWA